MADILFIMCDTAQNRLKKVIFGKKYCPPPSAFLHLAAVLEKNNFVVRIIDARIEKHPKKRIIEELAKRPLLVGFSVMIGSNIKECMKYSAYSKIISPKTPIVWGGIFPTNHHDVIMDSCPVDIILKGEGEITLLELAKAIKEKKDFSKVRGTVVKIKNRIINNPERKIEDINKFPVPAWHHIKKDINKYLVRGYLKIFTSRGCIHNCGFCYSKNFHKHYRARDANEVVDEIKYLINEFNIRKFNFNDDNFFSDKERVIEICDEIIRRKLNINFHCNMRIDDFDETLIQRMKSAGFNSCFVGIESANQKTLDFCSKGILTNQIKTAAKLAKKYDIACQYSFICGFPEEGYSNLIKTIKLAEQLHEIDPNALSRLEIYSPDYNTGVYKNLKIKHNFKEDINHWINYSWKNTINKPWIKNKRLVENLVPMFYMAFLPRDGINKEKLNFLSYLLKKWSKFRIEHRFFSPAPEFTLINLIKHILVRI